MALLNAKLRSVAFDVDRERAGIAHWCPGCDESHAVCTRGDRAKGPLWSWNGSLDAPSLSPSVRIVLYGGSAGTDVRSVCHALAGRIVELPDWPGDHDESGFYLKPPSRLRASVGWAR